ncbi:MAG: 6-phosphofructokinase, partial [Mollicutes bacterium]|nr:6-phosphofructokinase [Mollicutes bacterium]
MNSALIGAIRSGINANKEMYVIYDGYKGLIEGKIQKV